VANGRGLAPFEAIARFAGHVFAGVVIFFLIALPALGLHFFIHEFEWDSSSKPLLYGLTVLEYAIFVIDALLFLAYLTVSAYRLFREL